MFLLLDGGLEPCRALIKGGIWLALLGPSQALPAFPSY